MQGPGGGKKEHQTESWSRIQGPEGQGRRWSLPVGSIEAGRALDGVVEPPLAAGVAD